MMVLRSNTHPQKTKVQDCVALFEHSFQFEECAPEERLLTLKCDELDCHELHEVLAFCLSHQNIPQMPERTQLLQQLMKCKSVTAMTDKATHSDMGESLSYCGSKTIISESASSDSESGSSDSEGSSSDSEGVSDSRQVRIPTGICEKILGHHISSKKQVRQLTQLVNGLLQDHCQVQSTLSAKQKKKLMRACALRDLSLMVSINKIPEVLALSSLILKGSF
ncbi:hypothetical protein Pelo_18513 [Pelomyxa schiedti]|nr:hypothetical protein Pelo_18513 [Pelomyxa schiedti]